MNNPSEKDMKKIQDGATAAYAMKGLDPILEAQELEIIARFKNAYRTNKLDLSKSLAIAAELCTLEDIKNKFKQKITVAESIVKKENRN